MKKPDALFFAACERIGVQVPLWTQGAGGNVSIKNGQDLWIKASGKRLDEVSADSGWALVNYEKIRVALSHIKTSEADAEKQYAKLIQDSANDCNSSERPSMETGFHAALTEGLVCHFHSLPSLLMAEEALLRPKSFYAWLEKSAFMNDVVIISHQMPGLELSQCLAQKASPTKKFYILQNHGVVIQGSDLSVLDEWARFEESYCRDRALYELLELCNRRSSPRNIDPALGPLKIYFPDTAVFLDRLETILEREGAERRQLKIGAWQNDPNAAELWLATQILYRARPELGELPERISAMIAGLPTEKFRRALA